MKSAVFRDVDDLIVRLCKLFCRQLQPVVHEVGVKAHTCKLPEQLHKMALGKTALSGGLLDGNIMVVKFLDIVQRIFQAAVRQLLGAVIAGDFCAVLVHVMEQEKQARLDSQLMGGIALPAVFI